MPGMTRATAAQSVWRWIGIIAGVVWLFIAFYPILYILLTSLRSQQGFLMGNPWLPTQTPTLSNYATVWNAGFARYFLNSVIVSVITVLLILVCALPFAYAVVRTRRLWVQGLFNVLLVGLALPIQAAIIPVYILVSKFHLYDTLAGLILPGVAFGLPLTVLILVNFVRDIPKDLYEAMAIEGAGDRAVLLRLVLPLSKPALLSVGIYNFVQSWNNFLFPLVLTQQDSVRVLPLALVNFRGQYTINVPVIMAAVTLSALPLILAYVFGRRYLLQGMLAGFSK
ncbi:carbohydrate ABC transporter permease [Alicyclobacillus macrosporangiidus]|uniref:Raffinose/stachyose/melibiose transport system permease protein n=1 Tax=Alicyclobacillus macrosporangiidus TaxID=392015 RepID=A0A1I7GA96_9BACL|nr:carbohydrate ABC transporter permease [Alicyclobacillus macrosporangiidus]SFU45378.1 raffinose/stachyose/melibiose transport system permease protein [Alicyclobacillus macrosporangiidus]